MKSFFYKLNIVLSREDKKVLVYLLFFAIFIAIIETIGISIIMPYISVANDFTLIEENEFYNYIYHLFSFDSRVKFIIVFGAVIVLFYLFRAIVNSIYIYSIVSFAQSRYNKIVNNLFNNYLQMPYKNFIQENSSSLSKVIINEALYITDLFRAVLVLASEILVFIFIYSILLYSNYQVALSITVLIATVSFFIVTIISRRIKKKGVEREKFQKVFYEVLNKGFNNIKMLKLQNLTKTLNEFRNASEQFTSANKISGSFQQFPRLILEAIGFSIVVVIIIIILYQTQQNISSYYGLITIFVLGLYRLLPSTTRILLSVNQILYYYKSLDLVYDGYCIEKEEIGYNEIRFDKCIELKNISFGYDYHGYIIHDLNLQIEKNEKIAFIGESGSGKSTLVDIIMGLLKVNNGSILVDGIELNETNIGNWRSHFGYIPQSVYLFDGTVAENVAFGLEIDERKVIEALKKSNIWDFLKMKEGLETYVGEGGVMLSGGQKQRIAIARALYKDPDILVLDEATSALDDKTESKIMDEIYQIADDKTLIIIAHRLSTIKKCNKIYRIDKGELQYV